MGRKEKFKQKVKQKEPVILSAVIVVVNLIISLLSEKLPRILVSSHNLYKERGVIDGINTDSYLLIFNIIVLALSIVAIIYLMCRKSNKLRLGYGILLILLLALLMPVRMIHKEGGEGGIYEDLYLSALYVPCFVP